MTRLTISEDPGEEFTVRGHNTVTAADDDEIVFYGDVTKVHVVPERKTFTIQVVTAAFVVEMDFADADGVREELSAFAVEPQTAQLRGVQQELPVFRIGARAA